jgi:hypothetical protein
MSVSVCDICGINDQHNAFNCSGCNKAVCKECYNKIRKNWNKDDIRPHKTPPHTTLNPDKDLIKQLELTEKPLTYSYSCPYCRCNNIKQYADLSKDDLLSFINKEYMTFKEISTANINLRTKQAKIEAENKELQSKLNEVIDRYITNDGDTSGANAYNIDYKYRTLQEENERLKHTLHNREISQLNMADNFNTLLNMVKDYENIKQEYTANRCELKTYKDYNNILNNKLDTYNKIVYSKITPKKAIDKLRQTSAEGLAKSVYKLQIDFRPIGTA